MNLLQILEALAPHQEQDAVRISHDGPDAIQDTRNPEKHKDLILSNNWKEMRDMFLDQHPEAKAMFSKGGEKREYQVRFKNALTGVVAKPTDYSINVFKEIAQLVDKVPGAITSQKEVRELVSNNNFTMNEVGPIIDTIRAKQEAHVILSKPHVQEDYTKGLIVIGKKFKNADGIETIKPVTFSIGKLLRMNGASPDLIHRFTVDPFRSGKGEGFDIIVTGHPIDIYGASTGRGWTSCADLKDKTDEIEQGDDDHGDKYGYEPDNAAAHIGHDIHQHVHIAYLVPSGGDIDHDAVARVTFKPHTKMGGITTTLISENRVYGNPPAGFLQKANEIVGSMFKIESGFYVQHKDTYVDDEPLKTIGDVKVDGEMFKDLLSEYNEIDDDDRKEEFISKIVRYIEALNQHDFEFTVNQITSRFNNDLDTLEDHVDFSDVIEVHVFFEELIHLARFINSDSDYSSGFWNNILRGLANSKKFNQWWTKSTMFVNYMHTFMENMFEHMTIDDDGDSNMDSLLSDFTTYITRGIIDVKTEKAKNFKLFSNGFHRTGSDVSRKMVYLFAHFPTVCEIFDWSDFAVNDGSSIENAEMIFSEYFDGVYSAHKDMHGGMIKEMLGLSRVLDNLTKVNYSVLDWLVLLENKLGEEKICEIEDLHTCKDWIEQYIYELNSAIVDVVDHKNVLAPATQRSADLLGIFLKKNCTRRETIDRCIELVDTGEFKVSIGE
jgi:hypothetical protein